MKRMKTFPWKEIEYSYQVVRELSVHSLQRLSSHGVNWY
jgi:hypothetical protein